MTDEPLTRNLVRRKAEAAVGQTTVLAAGAPPATILRPVKGGGTREYVTEVALGHDIIHDSEVDADLDTVFGGHNDLVAAFNALVASMPATPIIPIGATAPPAPAVGSLWWRTTDGNLYVYYNDGVTSQFVPAMASVGKLTAGQSYLLAGALGGVPPPAVTVGLYVAALPFTLPANLVGSQAVAKTAATAQADFSVKVNGVAKGTIRWGAAATVATFVWAAAVALAAGDRLEILAPAAADGTLADLTWTLRGTL
jgi:hypothetical protein